MILMLTLDLPGEFSHLRVARKVCRTVMEDFGVVEKDIDDVEFVLGELSSNVVRHAQSSNGRFRVEMEYYADRIAINVIDTGIGFSFKDVLPPGELRTDTDGSQRVGGFGLDLCRKLSDHLEFHRADNNGTQVRAVKQLSYVSNGKGKEALDLDLLAPTRI